MSRSSVPEVQVFAGGEVLLRGLAVARVEQALRRALESARRDGLVPQDVVELARELRTAVERQAQHGSGRGTTELPQMTVAAPSKQDDDLEVPAVARIAGVSQEYVRRLCRDTFSTARRTGGRWLVDRIEVEAWARSRSRRRAI